MKIFVVNAGSSSLKFQLFDMDAKRVLASGGVERVGVEGSFLTFKNNGQKEKFFLTIKDHNDAVSAIIEKLEEKNVIACKEDIDAVGHRIVNGGPDYTNPVVVTEKVLNDLKSVIELAPIHTPGAIMGIEACLSLFKVPNVLCFDTGFHSTMPQKAFMYAIKYEDYEQFKVRKYGFHGLSHQYVSEEVAKFMGRKDLKIINCHLGGGSSVCAIENGKCVDTSMGFTPLEGLVMGTRSGDIDASAVTFLAKKKGLTIDGIASYLTSECGVKGIMGGSGELLDMMNSKATEPRAELAFQMFCYRVKKYIGAYAAAMGGVDVISFTASVGERCHESRANIIKGLEFLGAKLDTKANDDNFSKFGVISAEDSKVKILVVPTNEELVIANATQELMSK